MSQSFLAHMRKDVRGEIERERRGHSKLLVDWEKRCCVTLVIEGRLGIALILQQHNNFDLNHVNCCLTSLWGMLWERLHKCNEGFLSHKFVLTHPRFAQMYENWTIDDWKHIIFNDKTKIARYNLDGRSWYWIWRWRMHWTSTCPSDYETW